MSFRTAAFRSTFRNAVPNLRAQFSRRWQSATADAANTAAKEAPPVKENLSPFSWNSPVGPKTVHFWAPVMKWVIVGVTVTDFARPADQLSLTQSGALAATGAIWTRWCLIIKPKNYLLAAVNFFLGCANLVQVGRVLRHHRSIGASSAVDDANAKVTKLESKAIELKDEVSSKANEAVAKVKDLAK